MIVIIKILNIILYAVSLAIVGVFYYFLEWTLTKKKEGRFIDFLNKKSIVSFKLIFIIMLLLYSLIRFFFEMYIL